MTNDTLAIYLTLIVSLMNAVGFCLQRKGQTLIPAKYSGFKLIIESIKTPLWLVGFLFVVGKMPLYIYSISIGDLSVVQPINATAILFIVIIGIFWLKETLSKWEITGMVAIVVGTIVIGLFYPVASVTVEIGQLWGSAAIFMVVCAVACVALLVIKQKEISMAFISGITMAIAVILVKLISFSLIGTPFTSVNLLSIDLDKKLLFGIIDPIPIYQTISWMFYGAILAIILSLLTLLFAFRAGKALFVAPIELISSILLPVFAGFWVFSETVNGPLILGILLSLAGALMLSGAQVRVEDAIKQKQPVSA
ncbi:MAG TPA: DMT family transporter, partial [Candidatus Lokiarchaeia archaeon]|nr:DMT family transporter [Candidatus Lokiarchaeia archaeon]